MPGAQFLTNGEVTRSIKQVWRGEQIESQTNALLQVLLMQGRGRKLVVWIYRAALAQKMDDLRRQKHEWEETIERQFRGKEWVRAMEQVHKVLNIPNITTYT